MSFTNIESSDHCPVQQNQGRDAGLDILDLYEGLSDLKECEAIIKAEDSLSPFDEMEVPGQAEPPSNNERPPTFVEQFRNVLSNPSANGRQQIVAVARTLGDQASEVLVQQLGSASFQARELASAILRGMGVAALPALERCRASQDAEVVRRADALRSQIEAHRPRDVRNHMEQSVPLTVQNRIMQVLSQPTIEAAGMQVLKQYGQHSAAIVVRELSDLLNTHGEGALSGDRGQQLVGVLERLGNAAAPALFAVGDDPNSAPALRRFAQDRIDALTAQLPDSHPDNWLLDLQNRVRRAGQEFKAHYDRGQLTMLSNGTISYRLVDSSVVRTGVELDGTRFSQVFPNVHHFSITSNDPFQTGRHTAVADVDVRYGVAGRERWQGWLMLWGHRDKPPVRGG